jgi:hypothetical protein
MDSITIDILDSRAMQFLKGLQELKLIRVNDEPSAKVKAYLKKMRKQADEVPSAEEIAALVEEVRVERHAKK